MTEKTTLQDDQEKNVVNVHDVEVVNALTPVHSSSSDKENYGLEKASLGQTLMASGHIELTQAELEELEGKIDQMTADQARAVLKEVYVLHRHDPRYSPEALERMKMFNDDPEVLEHPEHYDQLIYEMRILALLTTTSSAYPEVRAVAGDTDDPTIPQLTIRVWVIGTILSSIGMVINAIFSLRYPSISIGLNVIQLVAYPWGVAWAKWVPDWKILGVRINPGPFNRKEHMLITLMANLGTAWPPLQHLVFAQGLPQYFGMKFALNPGYQFLGSLSTNMIGFGFAGISRRFLVYPSYCVWPTQLPTMALNNAMHEYGKSVEPVRGPMRTVWKASMFKAFWVVFAIYFTYYFFPGFIFPNLQIFDWISWIKPTNGNLVAMTSVNFGMGLGFNPFPTLDYNYLSNPGGYFPMFIHYNFLGGLTACLLLSCIFYYRNVLDCGYLQISSPNTFDNKAKAYKVRNIINEDGIFDPVKYQTYSEPYMSATKLVTTMGTFAYTSGVLTHTLLYNRHELILGYKSFWLDIKYWWDTKIRRLPRDKVNHAHLGDDIHYKLMQAYPEVPEWWFGIVVLIFMMFGFICLGVYTKVNPAVVLMAPIMTVIFIIPIGIVTAVSGLEPSLNLISELIGGGISGGDTNTVQFFRMYGSEPVYHALIYSSSLKLAHYAKVAPRPMFWVQMWGGILGVIITVSQWQWMLKMEGICTPDAKFRLICASVQGDYSNFIFWGTLGAKRLFGPNGRFKYLLFGFLLGVLFPLLMFFLKKRFPRNRPLQASHPLLIILAFAWGGYWGTYIPGLFINYFSWNFLKRKYLQFWTRYNYVVLAALGAGIGINGLLVFWAIIFPGYSFPDWWGTTGGTPGCIGEWTNTDCAPYKIGPKGYFGPDPGTFRG